MVGVLKQTFQKSSLLGHIGSIDDEMSMYSSPSFVLLGLALNECCPLPLFITSLVVTLATKYSLLQSVIIIHNGGIKHFFGDFSSNHTCHVHL